MSRELWAVDAEVIALQSQLLDYTGHVNRGLNRETSDALVERISELRRKQGWTELDMKGRWRR